MTDRPTEDQFQRIAADMRAEREPTPAAPGQPPPGAKVLRAEDDEVRWIPRSSLRNPDFWKDHREEISRAQRAGRIYDDLDSGVKGGRP